MSQKLGSRRSHKDTAETTETHWNGIRAIIKSMDIEEEAGYHGHCRGNIWDFGGAVKGDDKSNQYDT